MARIELKRVAHSYQAWPQAPVDYAVRLLDRVWEDGGAHAVLGPAGCGKTTLLNIVSGLVQPSQGRVTFDGRDVTGLAPENRNIAQVFRNPVVYDTMTVFDNLAFPLRNRRVDEPEIRRRVDEVAGMLELADDLERRARGLGADVKQRISLGRGLVRSDVAVILFDEPLAAIDPPFKGQLQRLLGRVRERFRLTLMYVTRDPDEALTVADRVAVMHQGRVLQIGTPRELFEAPSHSFVGTFIGSPGMNLMPCRIDGDSAIVERLRIPLDPGIAARAQATDKALELGIRPEYLYFSGAMVAGAIQVNIAGVEDLGGARLVTVRLGSQRLVVKVPEDGLAPGRQGWLVFPPERTRIYAGGEAVN